MKTRHYTNTLLNMLKITANSKAIKSSYQVCYDVMVTFDMLPHTDSLERKTGTNKK